jgi:hypothetical protein
VAGPAQGQLQRGNAVGQGIPLGGYLYELLAKAGEVCAQTRHLRIGGTVTTQLLHCGEIDEGALAADRTGGVPGQTASFEVSPDGPFGDPEGLGGLGDGECV